MRLRTISLLTACLMLAATASSARVSHEDLKKQVADSERAFAATMKARDFEGFTRFVADEAIFISGEGALRGKPAVAQAWRARPDTGADGGAGDVEALGTYVALVAALVWLMNVHVPAGAVR